MVPRPLLKLRRKPRLMKTPGIGSRPKVGARIKESTHPDERAARELIENAIPVGGFAVNGETSQPDCARTLLF